MKIFVDENIPNVTVQELTALGHDFLDICSTPQQEIPDDELWLLAQSEDRMLVSTDKGLSRIVTKNLFDFSSCDCINRTSTEFMFAFWPHCAVFGFQQPYSVSLAHHEVHNFAFRSYVAAHCSASALRC